MTEIDAGTEQVLLEALFRQGAMTEERLEDKINVDQINADDIAA